MPPSVQLPTYSDVELAAFSDAELIDRMIADEDRVPRNVIDECVRRGDAFHALMLRSASQDPKADDHGRWWLNLHCAMTLGLTPTEVAGQALIGMMRRIDEQDDDNLQDWLAGYWPALFANKSFSLAKDVRALAEDGRLGWFTRCNAMEVALFLHHREGEQSLSEALDWLAGIAARADEDLDARHQAGALMLEFPREPYREQLLDFARQQVGGQDAAFDVDDVRQAYEHPTAPQWDRFKDPWNFYSPSEIATRQTRWAEEEARAAARQIETLNAQSTSDDAMPEYLDTYVRETPKVGRNEPCPCGSGKKFKQCCLKKELEQTHASGELAWRRVRRATDGYPYTLLKFITETYGSVAVVEAWEEFTASAPMKFDPRSPFIELFYTWFFYRWTPDPSNTLVRDRRMHDLSPARAHLQRFGKRYDPVLRRYVEGVLNAPLAFYEVIASSPGRGIRLREFFTEREYDVHEAAASESLTVGDSICAVLVACEGVTTIDGMGGYPIPPLRRIDLIDFGKELGLTKQNAAGRLPELDLDVIECYLRICEPFLRPSMPALRNTDGEPLAPQTLFFDIDSAEQAFAALHDLNFEDSEALQREQATCDAQGRVQKAEIPWLAKGNKMTPSWTNTALGRILIDGSRMCVAVNSDERAEKIKALIATRLGAAARYRLSEKQSMEKMLADANTSQSAAPLSQDELMKIPEVRAKLQAMLASHYETWPDTPLPALNGETPRQAARSQEGKQKVAALIDGIERTGAQQYGIADIVQGLRERLGIRD